MVDGPKAHTLSAEGEGQSDLDFGLIRFRRSSLNVFLITKTAILSKAYLVSKSFDVFFFFSEIRKIFKRRMEEKGDEIKNPFYQRKLRQLC